MPPANKFITDSDLRDLHGKVAIVTGSNMGLGYATVEFLARKGAKVYMGARSEKKALDAIKQLEAEGIEKGRVEWLYLDLLDLRKAKQSAEEFLKREKRLDILVNNAGVSSGPFTVDTDTGLLNATVINHISPFVFTRTLLPLLKTTSKEESSDVRIINLTSGSHRQVEVTSLADKASVNRNYGESYNGLHQTYGHSKLLNILYIKELQQQLDADGSNIVCISVDPGMVMTSGSYNFLAQIPFVGRFFQLISPLMFTPLKKGVSNQVFAAASPQVRENSDKFKGAYLVPIGNVGKPSQSAQNSQLAAELWNATELILREMSG